MSSLNQETITISRRYAVAFMDSLEDTKVTKAKKDSVLSSLSGLKALISGNNELKDAVSSPLIDKTSSEGLLLELGEKLKIDGLGLNFLKTIAQNERLSLIEQILTSVEEEVKNRENIRDVVVTTATEITDADLNKILKSLEKKFEGNLSGIMKVDESLIGGVKIQVGSELIDLSVKHKLENVRKALAKVEG